jgi:uncharacterized cofD-like protein
VNIPLWLAPGSTIKRWILIGTIGLLIVVLGIAYLFVDLYRKVHFSGGASVFVSYATLQEIPRGVRGALFLAAGVGAIWLSLRHLNRVIVAAMAHPSDGSFPRRRTVIGTVAEHRMLLRGPRIVTIGGGTGMSLLLHGLRAYSRNLTAIVTVADDGGSSGRLRQELRILPPGDFRQCIAALADVEPLMTDLLQYRFKQGSGLEGHSFGNLLIAAMADITGSFERAVAESGRVLAVRGRILPSTLEDVTLAADLQDRSTLRGESVVATGKAPIERVFLIPNREDDAARSVEANPEAMEAIRDADMIVIGPGSLYTSIMPNLLVPGIAAAIYASRAPLKVFACNVATEPGETDGYTACDFVRAVRRHVGMPLFDHVITNDNRRARRPEHWKSQVVVPGDRSTLPGGLQLIERDIVDVGNAIRHDAQKLAQVLIDLYESQRRTTNAPNARRMVSYTGAVAENVPRGEDELRIDGT